MTWSTCLLAKWEGVMFEYIKLICIVAQIALCLVCVNLTIAVADNDREQGPHAFVSSICDVLCVLELVNFPGLSVRGGRF